MKITFLTLALTTTLTIAGEKPLLTDDFNRAELGPGWHITTGDWSIVDGALHGAEIPADKHSAAARRLLVTQDATYSMRFRLTGESTLHFGFDPVRGELDKKGHLFSVIVTPTFWRILYHIDKSRPKEDPNKILAQADAKFQPGAWHTLKVTTKGNHVTAAIEGVGELKAEHPTFHVKKPTLVFRCIGDGIEIDDITVK